MAKDETVQSDERVTMARADIETMRKDLTLALALAIPQETSQEQLGVKTMSKEEAESTVAGMLGKLASPDAQYTDIDGNGVHFELDSSEGGGFLTGNIGRTEMQIGTHRVVYNEITIGRMVNRGAKEYAEMVFITRALEIGNHADTQRVLAVSVTNLNAPEFAVDDNVPRTTTLVDGLRRHFDRSE